MAFFEEMESSYVPYLRTHLHQLPTSVLAASCDAAGGGDEECRDEAAALRLKMAAVAGILAAGAAGVAIPLVVCQRRGGGMFVLAKAFTAGVILATGFVHMLHDAEAKLSDPCLPATPWQRFPFPGFVAMLSALGTLVVDFVGTHFYERKHCEEAAAAASAQDETTALLEDGALAGTTRGATAEARSRTPCTSSGCARTRPRTGTAMRTATARAMEETDMRNKTPIRISDLKLYDLKTINNGM